MACKDCYFVINGLELPLGFIHGCKSIAVHSISVLAFLVSTIKAVHKITVSW
jgi:hypothetical protein